MGREVPADPISEIQASRVDYLGEAGRGDRLRIEFPKELLNVGA